MHADTLEDLAETAQMDYATLQGTVDRWKEMVQNGVDEDFGRPALNGSIGDGPYYLIEQKLRFATTLGGVEIDENFHVYNESDAIIPNLYAIGEIGYGVSGDDTIQGSPLTWAVSSGRLLGKQFAK